MIPLAADWFRLLGRGSAKLFHHHPEFCNTPVGDDLPSFELKDVVSCHVPCGLAPLL